MPDEQQKDPLDIIREAIEQRITNPDVYFGGIPAHLLQAYILLRIHDQLMSVDGWLTGMNSTLDHIEESGQVL